MSISALDCFILGAYVVLLNPVLYCLWKHGKHGLLGWLPLQTFCFVRIIGSVLAIHNAITHSTSQTALIFSNIGLAPLMLAAAGVLHEARKARDPDRSSKWEWFKLINFHTAIVALTVLIVVGVVKEIDNAPHTPTILMKVGVIGLLVCWVTLSTWVLLSWFRPAKEGVSESPLYVDGSILLYGVLRAMPFILIREIYAILGVFLKDPSFRTSTAAKAAMSVVPELLCTMLLLFVGINTRNIGKLRTRSDV